jgi:hypothetical protein
LTETTGCVPLTLCGRYSVTNVPALAFHQLEKLAPVISAVSAARVTAADVVAI